jgi:hypothetical protein
MPLRSRKAPSSPADSVRRILADSNLSLADVSRASRRPENDLAPIPHNFYGLLRKASFSPSLAQLQSLSKLTGYQLVDWLSLFGFGLDDVARFQAHFPALRTVRLGRSIYQRRSRIPWFQDLREADLASPLVPLSRWLAGGVARSVDSLSVPAKTEDYSYVKIGFEDAFAFPDLLPGSIVRIDCRSNALERSPVEKSASGTLYLIEHDRGLVCSRLSRSGPKTIVLCSRQLPYAAVELREGSQARILGVADVEIRPTRNLRVPIVPPALGRFWTPPPLSPTPPKGNVGQFVRTCRLKSGLSFRQASERTAMVAKALGDRRYYCSPGALSDYETRTLPPRHIHKAISIAVSYFANIGDLLEHAHMELTRAGEERLPDRFLEFPAVHHEPSELRSRFLEEMTNRFTELPYFLHSDLPVLFGVLDLSVRDVFWAGGIAGSINSYSTGAQFLVVDRKQKTPRPSLSTPLWAQPAHILQRRDGSYTWGFCALQGETLIVRVCLAGSPNIQKLRHRIDAEVVGEVVGVVRNLQ